MDSGCIPVELICILADSSLILVDSSGFRQNPVIPAGMVGGVTSTCGGSVFVSVVVAKHVVVGARLYSMQ